MLSYVFFFQAEDGIRDVAVTGVQTCALPISVQLAGRCGVDEVVRLACRRASRVEQPIGELDCAVLNSNGGKPQVTLGITARALRPIDDDRELNRVHEVRLRHTRVQRDRAVEGVEGLLVCEVEWWGEVKPSLPDLEPDKRVCWIAPHGLVQGREQPPGAAPNRAVHVVERGPEGVDRD